MQALQVWDLVWDNESVLNGKSDITVFILALPGVPEPVSSIGPGDVASKEPSPPPTLTCLHAFPVTLPSSVKARSLIPPASSIIALWRSPSPSCRATSSFLMFVGCC